MNHYQSTGRKSQRVDYDGGYHPSLHHFDDDSMMSSGNFFSRLFGLDFSGLELFGKNKAQGFNQVDHGLNHVYLALNRAYKERDFLEVKVPGDATIYQSILLEIDPEEKTVLIDEFFPNTFVGLPGQKMHFSLRQAGGRSIMFQASIQERHEFDGSPVYVIAMPESLEENQRRLAFRMAVPSETNTESTFVAPDRQAYSAVVKDVSSDGVCIETSGGMTQALRAGDSLKNTRFEFAGIDIVCDLTVKNLVDKKELDESAPEEHQRIGAEFHNLPMTTRRQIQQSIMQLQREQLRRASQSREQLLN